MYLYTGVVEFAPFGSEQNRRSRSPEIANSSEDKVPRPSPKSIYQLADKVCTHLSQRIGYIRQLTNLITVQRSCIEDSGSELDLR